MVPVALLCINSRCDTTAAGVACAPSAGLAISQACVRTAADLNKPHRCLEVNMSPAVEIKSPPDEPTLHLYFAIGRGIRQLTTNDVFVKQSSNTAAQYEWNYADV